MKIRLIVIVMLFVTVNLSANEEVKEIYIVSAAGYKMPVEELIDKYELESNVKINAVFGNMQTIITYIKQTDEVSLIIGDSNFIKKSNISIQAQAKLGNGKLLLVFQKDINITKIADLTNNNIKRIGIPDPQKTIYGKAAVEYLKNNKLYNKIEDKLIILKTVPQVTSYLKSGNIDAGLINVTDYEKLKGSDLKTMEINSNEYSEIIIEAGLIRVSARNFYNFLLSSESKKVFEKYGL